MAYPPSPTAKNVTLAIPAKQDEPISPISPTQRDSSRRFRRPTISRPKLPQTQTRGLYETQKLLAHLLDRLETRERAPDLLDCAAIAARGHGQKRSKGKGRMDRIVHAAQHTLNTPQNYVGPSGNGNDDFDERLVLEEGQWDSEVVYDLVEQLRGLLVLANKQGMEVFGASSTAESSTSTPLRTKKKGRISSFNSPSPASPVKDDATLPADVSGVSKSGPNLLKRTMNVLRSLINIDCLHRTLRFRPLCPPNVLQSACLDLATYLYHQGGVKTQVETVEMVIDGFYGMGQGMSERLCEWIEGRVGELLRRLAKERGGACDAQKLETDWSGKFRFALGTAVH